MVSSRENGAQSVERHKKCLTVEDLNAYHPNSYKKVIPKIREVFLENTMNESKMV
jgi:hypothetical protein